MTTHTNGMPARAVQPSVDAKATQARLQQLQERTTGAARELVATRQRLHQAIADDAPGDTVHQLQAACRGLEQERDAAAGALEVLQARLAQQQQEDADNAVAALRDDARAAEADYVEARTAAVQLVAAMRAGQPVEDVCGVLERYLATKDDAWRCRRDADGAKARAQALAEGKGDGAWGANYDALNATRDAKLQVPPLDAPYDEYALDDMVRTLLDPGLKPPAKPWMYNTPPAG